MKISPKCQTWVKSLFCVTERVFCDVECVFCDVEYVFRGTE